MSNNNNQKKNKRFIRVQFFWIIIFHFMVRTEWLRDFKVKLLKLSRPKLLFFFKSGKLKVYGELREKIRPCRTVFTVPQAEFFFGMQICSCKNPCKIIGLLVLSNRLTNRKNCFDCLKFKTFRKTNVSHVPCTKEHNRIIC